MTIKQAILAVYKEYGAVENHKLPSLVMQKLGDRGCCAETIRRERDKLRLELREIGEDIICKPVKNKPRTYAYSWVRKVYSDGQLALL